MKKLFGSFLATAAIVMSVVPSVYAQPSFNQIKKDRQDIREDHKDLRQDLKGLHADLKNLDAHLTGASITAINGSSYTVSKDGKEYTVNTSNNTKLRRHFWGVSSLSELSVGDKVNVWGKWSDDAHTTIDASLIRDLSIMKRRGVFFGDIASIGNGSLVIHSLHRGDQTVYFDSNTKIVNRDQHSISSGDLKVGDRIRVKGMWDKSLNKVTELNQIKDFSIPAKPSPSPEEDK